MLHTAMVRAVSWSSYALSLVGVLCFAVEAIAQQSGVPGARLGFATTKLRENQGRLRLTSSWNPTDNGDSVWLVMARSQTVPVDSIRLFVQSVQPSSPSPGGDSTGAWLRVPSALLNQARVERYTPAPMMLLGVFNPSAVSTWTRRELHTSAARTLVAAEVWRHNKPARAQLFIDGSLDRRSGPVVVSQPARVSAAPVRK
jgi:hypothetical protein